MNKLIIINNGKLLLIKEDGSFRLPLENEFTIPEDTETFTFPGYIAFNSAFEEGIGIREAWQLLPEADYTAVSKGAELLNWSRDTRFCSRCGTGLRRNTEISKICPSCGREVFPSLWPAIVVLVIREVEKPEGGFEEEALLVHARTLSRPTVQTLVAGFVETGENLEECVAREVREETSLEIEDIRYVGSQSWPFPHQLMLGFTARYKSGNIRFADGELTAGGFFRRDSLPDLPTYPSLSRRIIDAWANKN